MKHVLNIVILFMSVTSFGQPISLYKENPHYFFYKGKPEVLIASTEHYGAIINPDFNFEKYLNTIKKIGLNHTRIWLGDYVEKPGDFCLSANTSAPEEGKFLAPWQRSNIPGFALGGNKLDLTKWNPAFFERLHAFMRLAADNGIVVET